MTSAASVTDPPASYDFVAQARSYLAHVLGLGGRQVPTKPSALGLVTVSLRQPAAKTNPTSRNKRDSSHVNLPLLPLSGVMPIAGIRFRDSKMAPSAYPRFPPVFKSSFLSCMMES